MMNTPDISSADRNWAIYANAAGLLVFTNIPFANVLGTFLIWLKVKSDPAMPFARTHAAAAFNFQLTWTLAMLIVFGLFFAALMRGPHSVVEMPVIPGSVIAYFAFIAVCIVVNLVASIVGCMRASDMKTYSYPLAIRFVS